MAISDLNAPPEGEEELQDLNKKPAQEEDDDDPLQQPTTRGRRERISLLPLSVFSFFFIHIVDDKEMMDGHVVYFRVRPTLEAKMLFFFIYFLNARTSAIMGQREYIILLKCWHRLVHI
jgi:hypothetical protein